jgi:hypothetical protein
MEIILEGNGNAGDLIYIFEAIDPDYGDFGKVFFFFLNFKNIIDKIFINL